ncbi:MAG: glycerol kinase GlpK [bacterium]|nr:glycerol kinase GlpK [bacterium]
MSYVVALDQGTTSSRAIVFDREGTVVSVAQKELRQIFPRPGWVEHDAEEIWSTQAAVAAEALAGAGVQAADIAAVGITNQRETTIVWDRATGRPVANAIVWQDRRTAPACDRLRERGLEEIIRAKTGLVVDAYFSGTKIAWILDHTGGARGRAERGELAFGTVDTWLAWKLTGGALHVTDPSNASRTMLFDIHAGDWDDELLAALDVPRAVLPEVRSSSRVYGEISGLSALEGVPLAGIVGDQQAATMGQVCVEPGQAKNTYGTGCFMLLNTGAEPKASKNNLLTTVAWRRDGRTDYALEGSVFIGGAIVQWLRDGLEVIDSAPAVNELAASVEDNGGVFFVPALTGLGAPHWDPHARGMIIGLTRGTTVAHIARAALEGIAYQVADLGDSMKADAGAPITELRVDGGAAASDLLMQFQADVLRSPVVRPTVLETTALGAAYMAGLAVGYWRSVDEIAENWRVDRRFEPRMPESETRALRSRWHEAVERAKGWERTDD